jgi:LPXTG-motif cell wall-anchored protein
MRSMLRTILVAAAALCVTAMFASAQTRTQSTETKKFQVIAVNGNDLVVRLPEGTRELTVPDDFRFVVNGQPLSVRELKPGMSGTATITTTTTVTPVTVTEIKDGTVAHVAGSTIIVRTAEGVKSFSQSEIDKRGVKLYRSGKPAQLSEFRSGDKLSATIITTKPPTVLTEKEVQATLAASGAPASPAPSAAAARVPSSAPATASAGAAPARKLPKTASPMGAIALGGVMALIVGAALTIRRRRLT